MARQKMRKPTVLQGLWNEQFLRWAGEHVTTREILERLNITHASLVKALCSGLLTYTLAGSRRYYPKKRVAELIKAGLLKQRIVKKLCKPRKLDKFKACLILDLKKGLLSHRDLCQKYGVCTHSMRSYKRIIAEDYGIVGMRREAHEDHNAASMAGYSTRFPLNQYTQALGFTRVSKDKRQLSVNNLEDYTKTILHEQTHMSRKMVQAYAMMTLPRVA